METFAIDIPADLYQRIAAIAVANDGESLTAVVERLVAECEEASAPVPALAFATPE